MNAITKKKTAATRMKKRTPRLALRSPIELSDGIWDRVAAKAYELWEERGHRSGCDFEDWHDAEAIVLQELHDARK